MLMLRQHWSPLGVRAPRSSAPAAAEESRGLQGAPTPCAESRKRNTLPRQASVRLAQLIKPFTQPRERGCRRTQSSETPSDSRHTPGNSPFPPGTAGARGRGALAASSPTAPAPSPPRPPPHQQVSSSSQPASRSSSSGLSTAASSSRPLPPLPPSPPPGSSGSERREAALGLRQRPSGDGEAAGGGEEGPALGRRLGLAGAAGRAPWRLRSCSFCFSSFFTSSWSFRTSASAFTPEPTSSMAAAGRAAAAARGEAAAPRRPVYAAGDRKSVV